MLLVAFTVVAASGWTLAGVTKEDATRRQPSASVSSPRPCGPICTAAYDAIARTLPHDRNNQLAHAILRTPHFSYLELDRALQAPTIPQVRARWYGYCRRRFPSLTRAERTCERMIDSQRPLGLPSSPFRTAWAQE